MRLGIADYVLKDEMARLPHVIERAREVHEARMAREQAVRDLAHSQQRLAELTEHLQSSIEQERAAISGKFMTTLADRLRPFCLISHGLAATRSKRKSAVMPRLPPACCSTPWRQARGS